MGTLGESYRVLGASEKLYKICAQPADYHISEEARNNDQVERLEDGEELGTPIDAGNVWHKSTLINIRSLPRKRKTKKYTN